jgi:hypothetical protein
MSESLSSFASDLSSDLQGTREGMRLAREFGRSLQEALVEIISQFAKLNFSRESTVCSITKIAGFKLEAADVDPDLWSFCMTAKVGISKVSVWVNQGPGIVLFEFGREYTPKTAIFKRAAVQFGQVAPHQDGVKAAILDRAPKQNWTPRSLWLTDAIETDDWVAPEELAVQIVRHLLHFDVVADMDAVVEQEQSAS